MTYTTNEINRDFRIKVNGIIEQETKRIIYKGNTIIQGWDEWGQKATSIVGVSNPAQFASIADAKRFMDGKPMRAIVINL